MPNIDCPELILKSDFLLSAGPPGFTNGTTARGKLIESRVKLNELEALKPKSDESPKSNTKVRFNLSVATIVALIILTVLIQDS